MEKRRAHALASRLAVVDVFGADLVEAADELVEGLAINHEARHSFGIVRDDVRRAYVLTAGNKTKRHRGAHHSPLPPTSRLPTGRFASTSATTGFFFI